MANIDSDTEQVKADPENSIQIGGASYIKLTASTYDVETLDGEGLVVNPDSVICKLVDGVPETTSYSIIDGTQPSSATFIPISNDYYVQTNDYGTMVGTVDGDTFTQAQTEEGDYIYIDSTNTYFKIRDAEGNELYLPLKDSDGHNLLRNDGLGKIVYWYNDEEVPIQYNGNSVYINMM